MKASRFVASAASNSTQPYVTPDESEDEWRQRLLAQAQQAAPELRRRFDGHMAVLHRIATTGR